MEQDFDISNGELKKYIGDSKKVVIPECVTSIGNNAFNNCRTLTSVTIPEGVTSIGNNAFTHCTNLKNITIPKSVISIGHEAFYWCDSLTNVTILEGVKIIGNCAFAQCFNLENVIIPESVTSIGNQVFSACLKTRFIIPETGSNRYDHFVVENGTLIKYKGLGGDVIIPEGVTSIGDKAFFLCSTLISVIIPESVTNIGKKAFAYCDNLRCVTISEGVASIGDSAFESCYSLTNVIFPKSVTYIGKSAFYHCDNLMSVKISDGIIEIGDEAFKNCRLKSVIIPKTVLKAGRNSFCDCQEITIYDTIDPEAKLCTEQSYDEKASPGYFNMMNVYGERVKHEIIVRSAETNEIKYRVWMGGESSQAWYYGTLYNSWGKNATFNFRAVDEVFSKISGPEHKIKVALNRLRYPEMLSEDYKSVYIAYLSRFAKSLVISCIDNDDIETVVFCEPFGIIKKSNIDDFLDYAAKKKAPQFSAYFMEYKNKNFGGSSGKPKRLSLSTKVKELWTVSKSSSDIIGRYKGNESDVVFPTNLKGVTITGIANTTSRVPDNYKNIVSVIIPEGYTIIGDYSFHGCINLETIILPSSLEIIGKDAFSDCTKLKEVIMPDKVKEIGINAFRGCSGLSTLKLSNGLKTVPGYAFAKCDSLKEIELPAGISNLEKGSFEINSLEKLIVHGKRLQTKGKCFGNVKEVYAHEGVMKAVYGIPKNIVKPIKTLKPVNDDNSVSFD